MERLTEKDNEGYKLVLKRSDISENLEAWSISLTPTGSEVTIRAMAVDKLAKYEDLEEQGKLLKPKCLPGDYVWEINRDRNIISEYEVTSVRYGINKSFRYMWTLREGIYGNDGFWEREIGKTVFFTKYKAEKALKNE